MNKVIVYQGWEEKFRARVVDGDGNGVRDENGQPLHTELFATQEEAVEAAEKLRSEHNIKGKVEVRETIQEVAERNKE